MRLRAYILFSLLAVGPVAAEACVKIRDGTDGNGPSDGLTCMTFGKAEVRAATKFGLRLESHYVTVRAHMAKRGWTIDFDSRLKPSGDGKPEPPECGSGYDAVCQVRMTKGKSAVVLTFSGTNEGFPLISVEAE